MNMRIGCTAENRHSRQLPKVLAGIVVFELPKGARSACGRRRAASLPGSRWRPASGYETSAPHHTPFSGMAGMQPKVSDGTGMHAVFDVWSMGVMLRELPEACAALAAGRPPQLPPLQASYTDFVLWQRGRLEDKDGALAPQRAYWSKTLAGVCSMPLRGDLHGPPAPSTGDRVPVVLQADLVRSLKSLAAACGATLLVVVLAAWKARPMLVLTE